MFEIDGVYRPVENDAFTGTKQSFHFSEPSDELLESFTSLSNGKCDPSKLYYDTLNFTPGGAAVFRDIQRIHLPRTPPFIER